MVKIFFALLFSAAAGYAQDAVLTPDLNLIQEAGAGQFNKQPPYLVRFAKGGRQLSFVAARHGKKTENAQTFKLVEEELKALAPDVVIIEGVFTACLECPPDCTANSRFVQGAPEQIMCDDLLPRMRKEAANTEDFYAASLAYDTTPPIPFIGGEIKNSDLKSVLLQQFTKSQFKRFYVLRALGNKVTGGFSCEPAEVSGAAAEALKNFNREYSEAETMTAKDLKFFRANCQNSPMEVQPKAGGTASQKVSAASSYIRDQHLAQVIATMLNNHKKVMIVYGAGHYETLYKVLAKMLGEPVK
ncbi:MAG TPA: hypothetical protein PKI19_02700 [Elusimicrobiales bacterium]|nr:hypothetical protein [Elusimicrobiales bacterium]